MFMGRWSRSLNISITSNDTINDIFYRNNNINASCLASRFVLIRFNIVIIYKWIKCYVKALCLLDLKIVHCELELTIVYGFIFWKNCLSHDLQNIKIVLCKWRFKVKFGLLSGEIVRRYTFKYEHYE